MTDITPAANELLEHRESVPIGKHPYSIETLNGFLKEAYAIVCISIFRQSHDGVVLIFPLQNARITELHDFLLSIRPSYLSLSQVHRRTQLAGRQSSSSLFKSKDDRRHLTNTERDQIDASAKQILRELNATINNLAEAENVRRSAAETLALKKQARGDWEHWDGGRQAAPSLQRRLKKRVKRPKPRH